MRKIIFNVAIIIALLSITSNLKAQYNTCNSGLKVNFSNSLYSEYCPTYTTSNEFWLKTKSW